MLLAGIFRVFGAYTFHAWAATVLVNISCCTLACIPIYFAAKRIGGIALAAGAAWLWAIFPNAILMPVESMWDASIFALLVATILWATLALAESAESQRLRNWCGYGLLWGVALMFNATLGGLFPFLALWLAYRAHQQNRAWFNNAAAAIAVIILCCIPWTIRNYRVFHQFVPLRSVLGLQLWLGNNDQTQDIFRGDLHPIYNAAERENIYPWAKLHTCSRTGGHRLHAFASRARSSLDPLPRDFHLVRRHSLSTRRFPRHAVAAVSHYPGVQYRRDARHHLRNHHSARERSPFAIPIAAFPLIYPWAYYLTLALPRYRLPIDPIVMLLLAISIQHMVQKLSRAKPDASKASDVSANATRSEAQTQEIACAGNTLANVRKFESRSAKACCSQRRPCCRSTAR